MTPDDMAKFRKLEDEAEAYRKSMAQKKPPLPTQVLSNTTNSLMSFPSSIGESENVKKRKHNNSISEAFDVPNRNQLDAEIARMFYTGGLPFNLARNPYYASSYTLADHNLSRYVPPGYNKLRTTFLEQRIMLIGY